MLKPFKIKVESVEHSREIQEWLFSLGYKWASGRRTPHHLDFLYLFFSKEIGDEDPTIGWSSDSIFFMDSNLPEAWFYDGKLQNLPPKNTLLEELHSVLDKYEISISLAQDCDNNHIMLLESECDETLSVYFEDNINSKTIREYIDACSFEDVEFEPSRQFEPYNVNYLGNDIAVPYTFKSGWLATDESGSIYVYRSEPVINHNIFGCSSLNAHRGIDFEYLGKINFTGPYKNWKESKMFFNFDEDLF